MENNCRWLDEHNKCWYWMPDSKLTCDCLDKQCLDNCKEYAVKVDD